MVLAVNVHGAAPADALTATPPEHEGRVVLVLDLEERIEHHLARLVHVQLVVDEARLLRRVVGVPAVDLESLHALGLLGGRVADGGHGAGGTQGADRGAEGGRDRGAEEPGGG